jgi:hypothetical protein
LLRINKIIIYDEPTVPEIQIEKLKEFLTDTFPIKVEIRKKIFDTQKEKVFEKIANTRIFDLKKPFQKHNPSQIEIDFEKENTDVTQQEEMFLYDGFKIQEIISKEISNKENNLDTLHIVFTNKLTCTFDENDWRYHARAIINSNPTIISTSGMVEAPAKPKEYYMELMTDFSKERTNEIKEKYKGKFLEHHDSRMSQIIEGYLLQSIMYQETGDEFCEDKNCRLYNAHWQKDLLYTQLENKKFCQKHLEIIKELSDSSD